MGTRKPLPGPAGDIRTNLDSNFGGTIAAKGRKDDGTQNPHVNEDNSNLKAENDDLEI